jgi:ubiquitin-protein ligase
MQHNRLLLHVCRSSYPLWSVLPLILLLVNAGADTLDKSHHFCCCCCCRWPSKLAGPEGTVYAGGLFQVHLVFSQGFPGVQPAGRFLTQIWHPNVHPASGGVCVELGYRGQDVCSIACVLVGLQMLLAHPNFNNSLNHVSRMQTPEDFEEQARRWTRQFAM